MSNLWYILNKSEHQARLNQQLQLQLRQQLELPPPGMSSDRFQHQFPPNNGQPTTPSPTAGASPVPPSRDLLPFGQQQFPPQTHAEVPFDPNAPAPPPGEGHNNIEWKYHTHRPEADGDALGRKAGKRKLVIPRDLLKMKQMNAALKIGIPPSTFSKRWRESLPDRTWPYRNHRRIEKNIKMLKAMQQKGHDVTEELGRMQQQQEENLSPAVIDVYEDVNEEYLLKVDDKKWPPAGPTRTAGSGPPTPHHHPYAPPQMSTSSQPPQPTQLQITAVPHSQMLALTQQPLPHSPTSQPKLIPHQQQAQAQPPLQTATLQTSPIQASPIQASPLQTSPVLQSPPTMQSPPPSVQTSPVQANPIQTSPVQTTPIQTSPIQPTPIQTSPLQTSPIQTSPIQASPIQTSSIPTSLQPSPPPTQSMAPIPQPTIPLQSQMLPPQTTPQELTPQVQVRVEQPLLQSPPLTTQQQSQQHADHSLQSQAQPQPDQSTILPLKIESIPQVSSQTQNVPSQSPSVQQVSQQPSQDQSQQSPSTFPQVQLTTPPPT